MSRRRCVLALVTAFAGCQDKAGETAATGQAQPLPAADIKVVDASGAIVAEMKATRPCRATVGGQELIVGGPPLVSTLGSVTWNGVDEPNGTILKRGDERIARIYPVGDPASGAVFDLNGVAQVRVTVAGNGSGTTATVEDRATVPVRTLTRTGTTITSNEPALTITGTQDLILAALLSAPELLPEVRMLAACERVLVTKASK